MFHQNCISNSLLPKFTDIREHNPAIREHKITIDFRKKLVEEQLKERQDRVVDLEAQLKVLQGKLIEGSLDKDVLEKIYRALSEEYNYFDDVVRERIGKKLSRLYGGPINLKCEGDPFINFSSRALSDDEKDFLNLGVNCHLSGKTEFCQKKTELELLYQDITRNEKDGKVVVSPDLRP